MFEGNAGADQAQMQMRCRRSRAAGDGGAFLDSRGWVVVRVAAVDGLVDCWWTAGPRGCRAEGDWTAQANGSQSSRRDTASTGGAGFMGSRPWMLDAGCWMLDAGTQIAATVPLAFLCRRAHQPASPPAHLVVVVVVAGVGRGRAETVCSALCSLLAPASDRHGLTRAATGDHGGMASAPGRPAGPTTPKSEREREPGGGVSRQMMALRASFRYTARHSLRLRRRSTAAQQSEWEPWCCSSTQSSP